MSLDVERFYIPGTQQLDHKKLNEFRAFLRSVPSSDVSTPEECREYIDLVAMFREPIEAYTAQNGTNFLKTVRSMLSVGADGLYENKLRFLFELVQNADDCKFEHEPNPALAIDLKSTDKTIVLRYNEDGFTPTNVFAITGIAEDSKNTSQDRLEIGEKGIGFKSVFGVAKSVLIRSGGFSFRLCRDHFTVPVAEYSDGFSGIKGTELTLEFDSDETFDIVLNAVKERYREIDALFLQNPVVFLNKIRAIDFLLDGGLLMGFSVSRPAPVKEQWGRVSEGTVLELRREKETTQLRGTLYSADITYDRAQCISRYGEETELQSRNMSLEAFFPDVEWVLCENGRGRLRKGVLYSYLPTQVETSVPVICHAPFKLDASRENVDSQKENAWFFHTITALGTFMRFCYCAHAKRVKQSIVAYLPKYSEDCRENFFVRKNTEKVEALLKSGLEGSTFLKEKIFLASDHSYHSSSEIVSLADYHKLSRADDILRLCKVQSPHFVFPKGLYPQGWNVSLVRNPLQRMYSEVFNENFSSLNDIRLALTILKENKVPRCSFRELCAATREQRWNLSHIQVLAEFGELDDLVRQVLPDVKQNGVSRIEVDCNGSAMAGVLSLLDASGSITYDRMGKYAERYFKAVLGNCVLGTDSEAQGVFPAKNVCVVVGKDPESQLIDFCSTLDPKNLLSVVLKLNRASRDLDEAMTVADPREYLKQLRYIRSASMAAMCEGAYDSYLELIQKSGVDASRYINELLQNADDCRYPEGVVPECAMSWDDSGIAFVTNEVGFTPQNVRAITAIGESMKRKILGEGEGGLRQTIGEKGVGFKSVFSIAKEVSIHSGGFHFKLRDSAPTVPLLISDVEDAAGTRIGLSFKDGVAPPVLSDDDILRLCVCLRRLRILQFDETVVKIADDGVTRKISINGTVHAFVVVPLPFCIDDDVAMRERNANGKTFSAEQEIRCYVPSKIKENWSYPLYCGLPTGITTRAPIIIDAPFELTTSRDDILKGSRWNECVRKNLFDGIIQVAIIARTQLRINVLHFFGIEEARRVTDTRVDYRIKMFEGGLGGDYLNQNNSLMDCIRSAEIIPIEGDETLFARPGDGARIVPTFLTRALAEEDIKPPHLRQVDFSGVVEKDSVLKILSVLGVQGIREDELWDVIDVLGDLPGHLEKKTFREGLYAYLKNLEQSDSLWSRPIVPVVTANGVEYVGQDSGRFFYSDARKLSTDQYYIVDQERMDRRTYETIFEEDLKEMNDAQEREFYWKHFANLLMKATVPERYSLLMAEIVGPNVEKFQMCWANIRQVAKNFITLKRLDGVLVCDRLYVCDFVPKGGILRSMVVDPECLPIAQLMECPQASGISYSDLPDLPWAFSDEDIEAFKDSRFKHGDDLLLLAVKNGRISEEHAEKYDLTYGIVSHIDSDRYEFPEEPIANYARLTEHIQEQVDHPISVFSKVVERQVPYCRTDDGHEFEMASAEQRKEMLMRYAPQGQSGICFCQMCGKARHNAFMEVNSVEYKPTHYWKQLRLVLCLECSKRFELLRNKQNFREDFIRKLKYASPNDAIHNVQVRLPLPGGEIFGVTFTRAHLAEIQEILRLRDRRTFPDVVED